MKLYAIIPLCLLCAILLCCQTRRQGTRTGGAGSMVLDATCVPESLRDLVPLASRWGIADPEARDEVEKEMTAAQTGEVRDAVHPRAPEIRAWLRAARSGGACANETAAFGGLLELYEDAGDIQLMRGLR